MNCISGKREKGCAMRALLVCISAPTGALAAGLRLPATSTLWCFSRGLGRSILAAGALSAAMPAMAATQSVQISVNATVATLSEIAVVPAEFNETALEASEDARTTASLYLNLANGTPAVIELDEGRHPGSGSNEAAPVRRMSGPGGYVPYQIFQDSGYTQIWGSTGSALHFVGTGTRKTVQLYIRIVPGTAAMAGRYSDSIRIGITY